MLDNELMYGKYTCEKCGDVVLAKTIADIIENEKMCIRCLSLSKNTHKKPRRPRCKKETRPKTAIEIAQKKKGDEIKWGHLRNSKESN